VTGLTSLLMASAVIAASLLGGCTDQIVGIVGSDAETHIASSHRAPQHASSERAVGAKATGGNMTTRLASAALDDAKLSDIRGGYDIGSGVTVNFAFQQATYVDHSLTENVVIPTLTISPGQGTVSTGGLAQVAAGGSISSATVVANGGIQTQVSVSNSMLQALVNSGMASVIGPSAGNGGTSTTLINGANNQLIQQMTTIDIGVSGLSKLMQPNIASSALGRIAGPSAFR